MSKKLIGNGLWESSHMMLPEHVNAILSNNRTRDYKHRKELDVQKLQEISDAVMRSMLTRQAIVLEMFDDCEDLKVIGVVEKVDLQLRRIRIDGEWFNMDD